MELQARPYVLRGYMRRELLLYSEIGRPRRIGRHRGTRVAAVLRAVSFGPSLLSHYRDYPSLFLRAMRIIYTSNKSDVHYGGSWMHSFGPASALYQDSATSLFATQSRVAVMGQELGAKK